MCVIVYKNETAKMPSKKILKQCFNNNPDGAGFMYAKDGKVYIEKGFMTFAQFWKGLSTTRKKVGDNIPYVLHFRITTQAGVRPDCTHPFPLSKNMDDLRKLSTTAEIGVAHNGIITLTSGGYGYYSYAKTVTYNDTMEFITDYLSLIIKDKKFYEDEDTVKLIAKLCESRLAILDGDGHCQLIGTGWIMDNDVVYSNDSYKPREIKKTFYAYADPFDDDDEYAHKDKEPIYDAGWYCGWYDGDEKYGCTEEQCWHCKYYESCYGEENPYAEENKNELYGG